MLFPSSYDFVTFPQAARPSEPSGASANYSTLSQLFVLGGESIKFFIQRDTGKQFTSWLANTITVSSLGYRLPANPVTSCHALRLVSHLTPRISPCILQQIMLETWGPSRPSRPPIWLRSHRSLDRLRHPPCAEMEDARDPSFETHCLLHICSRIYSGR